MNEELFRVEIIANQSVEEEIAEALEEADENIYYTFIPSVQGKGRQRKRLGNETWPELNCLFILYVDDITMLLTREIINGIKARFPNEGIKIFVVPAMI